MRSVPIATRIALDCPAVPFEHNHTSHFSHNLPSFLICLITLSLHSSLFLNMPSPSSSSSTPLLVLFVTAVCLVSVLVVPVSCLQPICSLAPASRPAAFPSGTQSYVASLGSYALYAETAFTTFINNMYNYDGQFLLAQQGSSSVSNYWNTAVAIQGLLQYATFHANHGIGGLGWGANTVISTAQAIVATQQTESGENDSNLRDGYNDDMSWMIHALTLLYQSSNDATYVTMANTLLTTVQQSDDTSCCGSHPGGVWWDTAHTSKATAAQMGVTVAALRLRETGTYNTANAATLLQYAESHYSFWKSYFVNTATGQVVDHEDTEGDLTWWGFTYNNGLMLGAAVHLYQATNTASYLTDAALWASYLLAGQSVNVNGTQRTILNTDCGGGCDGDCSQFHQVSFHYLTEYYSLLYQQAQASGTSVTQAQLNSMCNVYTFLQANIDSLWINARSTSSGLYNCNWNTQFSTGTNGLQGSMNSAMSAFALFASLPVTMVS